jgi:hypothetical protein
MKERRIWQRIEQNGIKQKAITMPHEKLKDAFINILAGGKELLRSTNVFVQTNLAVGIWRNTCAEQSVISETLNACTVNNADQLEEVVQTSIRSSDKGTDMITRKPICFWMWT